MKHLDSFMGFQTVRSFPSIHVAYMWFTYNLSGSWKDTLYPAPNPDFVHLLSDFFWLHLAFTVAYLIQLVFKKSSKEFLLSLILLSTLSYIYFFIKACVAHTKYNLEMKYSILQVEDVVHFFVIIELVTYATALLVVMFYVIFASLVNEKQVKKEGGRRNDGLENREQPGERLLSPD
jgi:hypothetical protein